MFVSREPRLVIGGDGVDVRGPGGWSVADVEFAGPFHEFGQHEPSPPPARLVDQRIEGVDPFPRLVGIAVGELVYEAVDHSWSFSR